MIGAFVLFLLMQILIFTKRWRFALSIGALNLIYILTVFYNVVGTKLNIQL